MIVALRTLEKTTMQHMRALSIRQPYAEQILRGNKKIEYRSRPTNIRERVYIYASLTPGYSEDWDAMQMQPGDLPSGVLVGTVEIIDCRGKPGDYEWLLTKPDRLKRNLNRRSIPSPYGSIPFSGIKNFDPSNALLGRSSNR
jgi:hypothetical protein